MKLMRLSYVLFLLLIDHNCLCSHPQIKPICALGRKTSSPLIFISFDLSAHCSYKNKKQLKIGRWLAIVIRVAVAGVEPTTFQPWGNYANYYTAIMALRVLAASLWDNLEPLFVHFHRFWATLWTGISAFSQINFLSFDSSKQTRRHAIIRDVWSHPCRKHVRHFLSKNFGGKIFEATFLTLNPGER